MTPTKPNPDLPALIAKAAAGDKAVRVWRAGLLPAHFSCSAALPAAAPQSLRLLRLPQSAPLRKKPTSLLQVILACEAGGTLEPSVNFPTGKVSRSLKAAWKARACSCHHCHLYMHLHWPVLLSSAQGVSSPLPLAVCRL